MVDEEYNNNIMGDIRMSMLYGSTEGLNLILGIALLTNIISNIINIIYLKKE